jgi:hypothetical protein
MLAHQVRFNNSMAPNTGVVGHMSTAALRSLLKGIVASPTLARQTCTEARADAIAVVGFRFRLVKFRCGMAMRRCRRSDRHFPTKTATSIGTDRNLAAHSYPSSAICCHSLPLSGLVLAGGCGWA